MPPGARWGALALLAVFAAMAADGLRTGNAWSRTGRDTSRRDRPIAYWLSIACQIAMAGVCLWCAMIAWRQPA